MTLFNLYLIEDPNKENHFLLETYDEFYKDVINLNRTNSLDWTNKIDYSSYTLNTNINLPKQYNYTFEEDSDVLNEFYSDRYNKSYGELTVNDSKGYSDPKEIEVIFAPTVNISHSLNSKSLPVLYKSDSLLQGKKKPFQTKLRLLYFNGEKSTATYDIHYRGNTFQTINRYGHTSMLRINSSNEILDTLFWDIPSEFFTQEITQDESLTLYNKYHKNQLKSLIDDNLIVAEFSAHLHENDISNLDFRKPIFIETPYGYAYFKLINVEYRNSETISKIRVMKIVN